MSDTVQNDKVVVFHYTLTNNAGETIDASGDHPLPYLHGHDNIVPGLERQIDGKSVGDTFVAIVPPEEGYGERMDVEPQKVPKEAFPEGFPCEEGQMIQAEADDGELLALWIVAVEEDHVLLDPNHPLAGETLNFDIEIVKIRDAKEDELTHGHPHGIDGDEGHHH